jgi:hypothetical protein
VCGWWKAEHEGNDTSHLDAIEAMHKPSGVDHSQFWEVKGSDESEKNQISFDELLVDGMRQTKGAEDRAEDSKDGKEGKGSIDELFTLQMQQRHAPLPRRLPSDDCTQEPAIA